MSDILSLTDQSDIDLRHALANLVGVVLGCPSRSTHLWYHVFSPEELQGTYLTGFMVIDSYALDSILLWLDVSTPLTVQ